MSDTQSITATTPPPTPTPDNTVGIQFNLEGVGIFLGILISLTILGGIIVQFIIDSRVKAEIQKLIDEHAKTTGHDKLESQIGRLQRRVVRIETQLDMEPMTFSMGNNDE